MLRYLSAAFMLVLVNVSPSSAEDANSIESLLARPILEAGTPLKEVRRSDWTA